MAQATARVDTSKAVSSAASDYAQATHDFDDPGGRRRSVAANILAANTAKPESVAFVAQHLGLL